MKRTAKIPVECYEGLKRVAKENNCSIDSALTSIVELYMEQHNINTEYEGAVRNKKSNSSKCKVKRLDNILAKLACESWRVGVPAEDTKLCDYLAASGYIEIEHRQEEGYGILLTQKGSDFIGVGGFKSQRIERIKRNILPIIAIIISILAIAVAFFK